MLFYDEERINPFYAGTVSFLNSLSFFFVIIAGLAVSLAILNSLTINIIERSQEIGTFRSLGFTQSQMAWLMGREMVLLSILSLVAGIVLTQVVANIINHLHFTFEPPGASGPVKLEVAIDWKFQLAVFAILSLLVALGSFLLAKRKLRSNIIELLVQS
jgi:putative ABC transport system permease protein